ncbi:hypothetical protein K488DRAFT_86236 [Vararia minispora EC-137]|uniref:Uncharacterized protein n=1 Tax=Vararia minispora EC-137 TaxID=1314806 RepID=A0ACB8QJZ6_9AGAM|nr:hypothetical protein K488DRAFT_86236 [Vararia minispora EC-137]
MNTNVQASQHGTADMQRQPAQQEHIGADIKPDNEHGQGRSHATGESIVPRKLQEVLPESVERAVPNAIHDTSGLPPRNGHATINTQDPTQPNYSLHSLGGLDPSPLPLRAMPASPTSEQQPIRRAKVTYGRRNVLGAMSTLPEQPLPEARKRSFEVEVIPDSEGDALGRILSSDDVEMEDESADPAEGSAGKYRWDWKERLAAIDELPGDQLAPLRDSDETSNASPSKTHAQPTTPVLPTNYTTFESSLSSVPASSPPARRASASPPLVPPHAARHRSRGPLIGSSPIAVAEDSQTTESSPAFLFGTSQEDASLTPPTSDEERDTDYLPVPPIPSVSKGKERERNVPPIPLEDLSASASQPLKKYKTSRTAKVKPKKMKRPTKKDQRETLVASARLRSDQDISISSTTKVRPLSDFIQKLGNFEPPPSKPLEKQASAMSLSDIQDFSDHYSELHLSSPRSTSPMNLPTTPLTNDRRPRSPPKPNDLFPPCQSPPPVRHTSALGRKAPQPRTPSPGAGPSTIIAEVPPLDDDDDDDMPDVGEIFEKDEEMRNARRAMEEKERLRALKLASMENPPPISDDEDDGVELEITDDPRTKLREAGIERRGRALPTSAAQKQLGFSLGREKATRQLTSPSKKSTMPSMGDLARAARPSFGRDPRSGRQSDDAPLTKEGLDEVNLAMAGRQASMARAKKEKEWVRRGGGQVQQAMPDRSAEAIRALAEMAANREAESKTAQGLDEDEEDEDFIPAESGSEVGESEAEVDENTVHAEFETGEGLATPVAVDADEQDEEPDSLTLRPQRRRPARKPATRAVIDSDAESDPENVPEGELTDKENVRGGLFEPGEDKENTTVARSAPLFSLTATSKRVMSDGERSPFKEIVSPPARETDDPFIDVAPGSSLQPAAFITSSRGGMSQFFNDDVPMDAAAIVPAPALQPAAFIRPGGGVPPGSSDSEDDAAVPQSAVLKDELATAFDDTTQDPISIAFGSLADDFQSSQEAVEGGLDSLRPDASMTSLSQDDRTKMLQPALEVSAELHEKFDRIFEKEQEYIIAAAQPRQRGPVYYVNDNGYLTQTRPEGDDVQIWRPSPSQTLSQKLFRTQTQATLTPTQARGTPSRGQMLSAARTPLGTLAESPVDDTPAPRRIIRKGELEALGYRSPSSLAPVSKSRDAMAEMMDASARMEKERRRKERRRQKSGLVEEEAEESDEDISFGFGGLRKKDDDDDDEDDDGRDLEGLVDDKEMSEKELGRELVQEKVLEQNTADDAIMDKKARNIVTGVERQKRRAGGVDVEDSDEEEDEDEEKRNRRHRMNKKRKIKDDKLDDLAKNEDTKAFHASYFVQDDNSEFVHLLQDQDQEMADSDGDDNEGKPQESVSSSELLVQLRQAARRPTDVPRKLNDPGDVDEEQPQSMRIRFLEPPEIRPRKDGGGLGLLSNGSGHTLDPGQDERHKKWAAEAGAAGRGTARAAAGASITGNKRRQVAPQAVAKPKPVKKSESMLAGVIGKRSVQQGG